MTGRPTYAPGLTTGRNPYGGKIKPAKFSKSLGKAKQLLERKYDKEGDENTPSKLRRTEPSGQGRQGNLPVKSTSLRIRNQK